MGRKFEQELHAGDGLGMRGGVGDEGHDGACEVLLLSLIVAEEEELVFLDGTAEEPPRTLR